jgi:hypothetical protein
MNAEAGKFEMHRPQRNSPERKLALFNRRMDQLRRDAKVGIRGPMFTPKPRKTRFK